MKRLFLAVAIFASGSLIHAETQYVCHYGSSVMVSGPNYDKPKITMKTEKSSYGFYVDISSKKAEYINLSLGTKEPIGLTGSSALMLVLTELAGGDNHFTATVFLQINQDGTFPSVMSQHSWSKHSEFYRPTISIGYCVLS